ncbi:MAG TPA: hypothetical protein VHZ51_20330 [Ktedonobacteraceae bacterium]|nr:hypothetical protein [Ktedonobacteraceae bacterium]
MTHYAFGSAATQEKPISTLLTMADQHQLKSVTINGNNITAQSARGQQYQSVKEANQTVTDQLSKDGATVTVADGQQGQIAQGAIGLLLLILLVGGVVFFARRGSMGGGIRSTSFTRSKAKRFNESHPSVLFHDVAGVEEAKIELQEIVAFLKYPERFEAMGARTTKACCWLALLEPAKR